MAHSVRALLDTVVQALPEVGNLGLLFFLLFFIFAALGVELFGRVGKLSTGLPKKQQATIRSRHKIVLKTANALHFSSILSIK